MIPQPKVLSTEKPEKKDLLQHLTTELINNLVHHIALLKFGPVNNYTQLPKTLS